MEGQADFYKKMMRTPGDEWDQFGAALVSEKTPIIELNSSYGVTALRDRTVVSGTGSVTDSTSTGEILVATGTTAGSTADLESKSRGRYIPGYSAEIGIGIRIPTLPTDDQTIIWGGLDVDEEDGFYFGVDATGVYVAVRRGTVDTKVYQSSWNVDKLDGTGESSHVLDLSKGNIFQIKFTWYGYGQILFGVVVENGEKQQRFVAVHAFRPDGATSVLKPNIQLHVEADNGTTTTDVQVYVGGRNYSVIGKYIPDYRSTGQTRGSVATSTTAVPTISFRFKTGFEDRSVKVAEVEVIPATEAVIVELRLDVTTLTGASWITPTNHTAAETALEADISATAVAGGQVIYTHIAAAGQGNKFSLGSTEDADVDIPEDATVTMTVRTFSGTGTVLSHLRMKEEW